MNKDILNLVPSALTVVFAFYGCFHFIREIFVSVIPLGILLTAVLVIALYFLKVPQPPQEAVEAIIGKDLLTIDENQCGYVVKTVAHRGAGLDAPENSLVAFDMCKTGGCDFIEFDITLTSDGVPIIFHDSTLERMADSNVVVNDTTYEMLKGVDISVKHPLRTRFGPTNIPTLDETVTRLLANGQKMFIDIKDNNTKMVSVILELFAKYPNLYSGAVVSSFFPYILYLIRRADPKIVCSMAYRPHAFAHEYYRYPEGKGPSRSTKFYKHFISNCADILHKWALTSITYYMIGLSVILLHKDCLCGENILSWRNRGVGVMVWTVNSPIEKQHITRNLRITYLTDTLTGESSAHGSC